MQNGSKACSDNTSAEVLSDKCVWSINEKVVGWGEK